MSSINRMSQQPWSPTASNGWCENGDPDGWDLDVFNGCSFFFRWFHLEIQLFLITPSIQKLLEKMTCAFTEKTYFEDNSTNSNHNES